MFIKTPVMNTAIIVAAGLGKRFGAEKPKQFIEVFGKPLIVYTLQKFENCPAIDEIILVLPSEEAENFSQTAAKFKIKKLRKITTGGQSRAESVLNGLNFVSGPVEIIAVHDGARPLVAIEEITRTIEKARECGAACLVGKVTDTIKKVENGKIVQTVDRSKLRRALTPQCFQYEILKRAFAENAIDETITDESFLAEKLKIEVSIIEGNDRNIKITTPEDLIFAANLLKEQTETANV